MMVNTLETFIPYDQKLGYIDVEFVSMERSQDYYGYAKDKDKFSDIMVVKYKGKNYELNWHYRYAYFSGKIGKIEGYIP